MLSATKTNSITYALVWDKLKTDKTSGDVTSGNEDEEDELRAEVTAALRWTPPFSAPPPKTPNHRLHIGTRASGLVGSVQNFAAVFKCILFRAAGAVTVGDPRWTSRGFTEPLLLPRPRELPRIDWCVAFKIRT